MKAKTILMLGIVMCVGVILPTNIIGYATSDISYVETVGSEIDVASIELNMGTLSGAAGESVETEQSSEIAATDESGLVAASSVVEDNVVTDIAEVLGMDVDEDLQYSLVFGEELLKYNIIIKSTGSTEELEDKFKNISEVAEVSASKGMGEVKIVDIDQIPDAPERIEEPDEPAESDEPVKEADQTAELTQAQAQKQTQMKPIITNVDQSDALLQTAVADENYRGVAVQLSPEDRDLLERLVQGEAGAEGFEGAALVAQAIRDTMVYKGFNSVEEIRVNLKYSGTTTREPNETVKSAVAYIFDNGGIAVKHTIFYFYAPKMVQSSFHESQLFVVEHKGHRFFSNR